MSRQDEGEQTLCENAAFFAEKRDALLQEREGFALQPYQARPSNVILNSVCGRGGIFLTMLFMDPDDKVVVITYTAATLALNYYSLFGKPIQIGFFAPTHRKAGILFDKFRRILSRIFLESKGFSVYEHNADSIVIYRSEKRVAEIHRVTAYPGAKIKGYTFGLIIIDECQDVTDKKIGEDITPMGAATCATNLYLATPGLPIHNVFLSIRLECGKDVYVIKRPNEFTQ